MRRYLAVAAVALLSLAWWLLSFPHDENKPTQESPSASANPRALVQKARPAEVAPETSREPASRVETVAPQNAQALDTIPVQERAERILLEKWERRLPKSQRLRTTDTVDSIAKSQQFNPNGRTLTAEQSSALGELVEQYNTLWESAGEVHRQLHWEASLQALRSGQFVSISMNKSDAENQKLVSEAKQSLANRLGKELSDWKCEQVFWSSSGGDSQMVLVWYTIAQNAEAFQAGAAMAGVRNDRSAAYKKFFAGL